VEIPAAPCAVAEGNMSTSIVVADAVERSGRHAVADAVEAAKNF